MPLLLQFVRRFPTLTVMAERKECDSSKGLGAARHWPKVLWHFPADTRRSPANSMKG